MGYAIRKLTLSNIRKRKSAAVTLMALIMLTVMLLNIGLSVTLKLGSFQEKKMAELHVPDVLTYYKDSNVKQELNVLANQFPGTAHTEEEAALLVSERKLTFGDSVVLSALLALRADASRTMSPLRLIEEELPQPAGTKVIYLPYMFELSGGYKAGDTFSIPGKAETYSFVIGGFFEEALLGTFTGGAVKVFVNEAAYSFLEQVLGKDAGYRFLSVALADSGQGASKLSRQLSERLGVSDESGSYVVMNAEDVLAGNRFLVNMLAVILVVFSLLMVLIALVVIRFQILVQIEDYMVNIGVLKANGYTSRQIRQAVLLQYLLVSLAAAVPGLAVSGAVMPFSGNMISSSMGLLWPSSFDRVSAVIALPVVVALVLLVATLSSRRIRSITPITALRNGLNTHAFERNPVPLFASRLPLQLALGLKALCRQTKQNVMLVVIVAGLTFSSVFCFILQFNMTRDNTEVIKLVGVERSSVQLTLKQGKLPIERLAELAAMEGVTKLTLLDNKDADIQGRTVLLQVSDDFSKLSTQTVYRGRHPLHDNEISVSGIIAKRLGKTVGDEVEVTVNGASRRYLITGLSQQISQLGMVASMTDSGYRQLVPGFTAKTVNFYLDDRKTPTAFANEVETRYPGDWHILNVEEWLEGTLQTFTSSVTAITWTITAVTILVVCLILYLIIKTLILKRKQEFGILKGLGFTSFQLMTQITFSLLPVIILGVALGCVVGYFYSDSLFVLLLSSLGIYNVEFTVSLPEIVLLSLAVIAVAYAVCMLVSRRIRKISVYGLISD